MKTSMHCLWRQRSHGVQALEVALPCPSSAQQEKKKNIYNNIIIVRVSHMGGRGWLCQALLTTNH